MNRFYDGPAGTGNRNDPARKAAHRAKMMGKFFRNKEPAVTRTAELIAKGHKPRPNMAARSLAKHFTKAQIRRFI